MPHKCCEKRFQRVIFYARSRGFFRLRAVVPVSHCRGDSRKMHFHNVTGHYKCVKLGWLLWVLNNLPLRNISGCPNRLTWHASVRKEKCSEKNIY